MNISIEHLISNSWITKLSNNNIQYEKKKKYIGMWSFVSASDFRVEVRWQVKGERWHIKCASINAAIYSEYLRQNQKNFRYWKAKSERDLRWFGECLVVDRWQVTRDIWRHNCGKLVFILATKQRSWAIGKQNLSVICDDLESV